ncbi:retrovirus-related Pol polyprotein from transposon opus [Nephila pilipes]|uniref:Retrovirus-related Pol polyprotein from transposon opus n=1 Tax=Nephila pilipes TaxID=299642 RepID=A0A8X6N492_NEPPI|nr:retrovirus-related Pol polyprotein from transposon opus [Nephila pilipes]
MDYELQKLKRQLEAKQNGSSTRNTTPSAKKTAYSREYPFKPYAPKRSSSDIIFDKTNQAGSTSTFSRGDKLKTDNRSERLPVSCYGCDKPGVTKPRCPNCKSTTNKDPANFSNNSLHSCSSTPNQSAVLKLAREEDNFQKIRLSMSLADGQKSELEVYTTSVVIKLEGRVIRTPLIALPYAKGNRTLLGMNFLQKAGIVLNLKHRNWYFSDSPYRTYDFVKKVIVQEVQSRSNNEENTCLLRDEEGKCLTPEQRNDLSTLLKMF